ncbi:large-conductance mechanosensitive channel [Peribacillus deserti]|uniref:Large-conductance mechanosensitive channel n=1 Tax=Peribacillus deserti TaxID=673318 RepID=A0ABS2QMA5_9BACI|nr:large-conductance mechanosensitive channel [Peribacillus deserti]
MRVLKGFEMQSLIYNIEAKKNHVAKYDSFLLNCISSFLLPFILYLLVDMFL